MCFIAPQNQAMWTECIPVEFTLTVIIKVVQESLKITENMYSSEEVGL